ncbi:alpha/beta hydrolase-fold protein [Kocuria sp. TGY1127_2]|uniref:alpha/beta hydrolase-fold protein n=1 Tax=Kocuria sp. TGY1127_2 TaxID=2711328 RepID=UPI0015BED5EC|nr:alpha/beta hydrolase-fold protein [Kocuria sp. TGY1127_2]
MNCQNRPSTITGFLDEDAVIRSWAHADTGELRQWWEQVARSGTPINDPDSSRVTFLWRGTHVQDDPQGTESVHLAMNRVTDKDNYDHGLMRHVPGTDIWVRTLELEPNLRVSYGFKPMKPEETPHPGPPRFNRYDTLRDIFNASDPLVDRGAHGLSLYSGPLSPAQQEWDRHTSRIVEGRIFRSTRTLPCDVAEETARDHWLYVPSPEAPGADGSPVPLVTIFDAEIWFGNLSLHHAIEAAVEAGRIPPLAVLGISNTDTPDRIAHLGANSDFLRAVADHAIPWAEERAQSAGVELSGREDRVIVGQSLGGLSALVAALELPDVFGHALAHSPSLWWTPDGASKPRDLGAREGMDWITERFHQSAAGDVRVSMAVGEREGLTLPHGRILHQVMLDAGWATTFDTYAGGHDFAWWRGAVLDGLNNTFMSLLSR